MARMLFSAVPCLPVTHLLTRESDLDAAFDPLISRMSTRADAKALRYLRSLGRSHLRADYSRSLLLRSLGVFPLVPFVSLDVCVDGAVLVDLLCKASDGLCYSRHEMQSKDLSRYPLPGVIEILCSQFEKEEDERCSY